MKSVLLYVFAGVLLLLNGCSGMRVVSTTEHDSVYFASKDEIVYEDNSQFDEQDNANRYAEDDSRDDDFYYSRRMRRFSDNSGSSNWRYYDPYFSNDLYYVMGTPAWSSWNNNGWYNWTSPYFGSPWMGGGYGISYGYSPYMWGGGYNPWMSSYYGYSPWTYGYGGYNYGMYYPGYYSYYSPWSNPYAYNPYNNGYYGNGLAYNPRTTVAHRGNTGTLVNTPLSGSRPVTGLKPGGISKGNEASNMGNNGRSNVTPSGNYTTPRSHTEFGNTPPRVYTSPNVTSSRPQQNGTVRTPSTQRAPVYTSPRENTSPSRSNTPVQTPPRSNYSSGSSSPIGGGNSGGGSRSSGSSSGGSSGGGHRGK